MRKADIKFNSPEQFEEFRKKVISMDDHFNIELTGGETHYLSYAIEFSKDFVPFFIEKHWSIIEITQSCFSVFVTSDSPVSLIANKENPYGNGFPWAGIIIPISPRRLILMTNEELPKQINYIGGGKVNCINGYIAYYAQEYVFSNIESKSIMKLFKSNHVPQKIQFTQIGPYAISSEKRPTFLYLDDIISS